MLENLVENPSPFFQWLWTEPSWISLSHGEILVLGGLIGSAILIELVSHLRGKGSIFF